MIGHGLQKSIVETDGVSKTEKKVLALATLMLAMLGMSYVHLLYDFF